jgi:predicted nucleic acid-binding protein
MNRSDAVRANCFDASALVKRYVSENRSEELRVYWNREPTKFTTSLCFQEALTQLKVCHFYRKTLTSEQYRKATLDLCAWYGAVSKKVPELNFLSPEVFFAAQCTAEKHGLDLSDAFQIHSVKEGFFSNMSGDSTTILVTADRELAKAAKAEGLRVWSILDEPAPRS